ncbi:MAG: septum formation protein Maf [Alphaproteobacteria bacterium]|nr:septum formation protein Maf [Alphaproteobacteria bacterium]
MFILASDSITRKALLTNAGLQFGVTPPRLNELQFQSLHRSLSSQNMAAQLALEKAKSVCNSFTDQLIVGADQVLSLDAQILHKPVDSGDARTMLKKLRGKKHTLTSSISAVINGSELWSHQQHAYLTMRDFSDAFLDQYLALQNDQQKWSLGAYQLETNGIQLFEKIEGDYFTILGFPLIEFLAFLRQRGIISK